MFHTCSCVRFVVYTTCLKHVLDMCQTCFRHMMDLLSPRPTVTCVYRLLSQSPVYPDILYISAFCNSGLWLEYPCQRFSDYLGFVRALRSSLWKVAARGSWVPVVCPCLKHIQSMYDRLPAHVSSMPETCPSHVFVICMARVQCLNTLMHKWMNAWASESVHRYTNEPAWMYPRMYTGVQEWIHGFCLGIVVCRRIRTNSHRYTHY